MRAAGKQLDAAQGALDYDHFGWLPSIAAAAKGNYTSNPGFTGKNTSYDLLLTINVPLYDRGLRYAAQREDEAKLSQARAALESNRAKARANWISARANVESSKAILAQAEAQAQLQLRVQRQVEASAQADVATNLEHDRQVASQQDARRCGICYLHFLVSELHYREEEGFYVCAGCERAAGKYRMPMLRRQQK